MEAFDVLGDPVRRRILELLAEGEQSAGAITQAIRAEFDVSQPAVSQHLKVLRENGFATVRTEATHRLYAVDARPLQQVDTWLGRFRSFWEPRLDSLAMEIRRGHHARRPRDEGEQAGQDRIHHSDSGDTAETGDDHGKQRKPDRPGAAPGQ